MRGALRAVRGKKSSMQFFRNLNSMTARGSADLNQALRRGALEAKQAGVAIVLSDFLDPAGYEPGLTALIGRGFQVNAVQILAPEELNPTTYGDLRLVDSETGAEFGMAVSRTQKRSAAAALRWRRTGAAAAAAPVQTKTPSSAPRSRQRRRPTSPGEPGRIPTRRTGSGSEAVSSARPRNPGAGPSIGSRPAPFPRSGCRRS